MESATITLTNAQLGDQLLLATLPTGIIGSTNTSTPGVITISLSGSASKTAYVQALQAISFNNVQSNASTTDRLINVVVNDGDGNSNTAVSTLQVITVTSITPTSSKTVEGNPMTFTVSLSGTPSTAVSFPYAIANGSTAIASQDYTNTPSFSNGVTYDPTTGRITIPAGISSFTVTYPTLDDLVVEGNESLIFQIGTASATGLITDGAGSFISIDKITVNEGSPNGVFRVQGVEGQEIRLSLEHYNDDAAAAAASTGAKAATLTGAGVDTGSQLQVFDGRGWQNYIPGSFVTYPTGSTTLLVRVAILNDTNYEGPEAFKLIAEGRAIDSAASQDTGLIRVAGIGVISDDGRGPIYNESGAEVYNALKDDDRTLKISNININEGSDWGVFTITQGGGAAVTLTLALTNWDGLDLKTGEANFDMGQGIYIWDGSSWQPYAGNVTVQPNAPLYVRVDIRSEDDRVFEGRLQSGESIGESFRLTGTIAGGASSGSSEYGIAKILDDGTGVIYTGAITSNGPAIRTTGLNDDLDKDGIAPNIEEILATLSASSGGGGTPGDLNNDGLADAEQPALATLAWITADTFTKAIAGELTEIKPIIYVASMSGSSGSSTNTNSQLEDIRVLAPGDVDLDGNGRPSGGLVVNAPWDALRFSVSGINGTLDDIDPTRAGTQTRLSIDISRAGMRDSDFNAYYKYVSATALSAYVAQNITLRDLDGKAITTSGWYDFTQRSAGGDGARFITAGGQITGIELTITDNAFGDNNPIAGMVNDPGAPVLVTTATSTTSTPITPTDAPETRPDATQPTGATITPVGPLPLQTPDVPERPETDRDDRADDGAVRSDTTALDQRSMQQARDALFKWAKDNGLMPIGGERTTVNLNAAGPAVPASSGREPAWSIKTQHISALGPDLLEVLALGAAGLYLTQTVGQNNLEQLARQWWRKLRPMPAAPGWLAAVGRHSTVLSVFVVAGGGLGPKLVAAQILNEAIEILAEQPLDLRVPTGTPWERLDLLPALTALRRALEEQEEREQRGFTLLLLDPKLESYRQSLEELAQHQAPLNYPDLSDVLAQLNGDDQALLRRWLNQPSSTVLLDSDGCRRVMELVGNHQSHWSKYMAQAMSNVTGVLELSIALGNLQPDYSLL